MGTHRDEQFRNLNSERLRRANRFLLRKLSNRSGDKLIPTLALRACTNLPDKILGDGQGYRYALCLLAARKAYTLRYAVIAIRNVRMFLPQKMLDTLWYCHGGWTLQEFVLILKSDNCKQAA